METTHFIILHPREVEKVQRGMAKGENQQVLDALRRNLNTLNGDLVLSPELLNRVRRALRCWRDGGEKAFLAVLEGAARHGV